MPARNPFAEYANNKILTASPAEVTLMLYEGAIKFCNIAVKLRRRTSILKKRSVLLKSFGIR